MRRELFDYELPPDLIASHPAFERDGARLLVLDAGGALTHASVRELDQFLPAGALLVVNDTRVIPARLFGRKRRTGGRVELLLVRRVETTTVDCDGRTVAAERWLALGRASKGLSAGTVVELAREGSPETLEARVVPRELTGGLVEVLVYSPSSASIEARLDALGHVPLPPYLHRPDDVADRERYQTVFAASRGAIAAPTAGLHFSPALLDRVTARGIERAAITLHVGLGTFQPVTADDFDAHPMHAEWFEVNAATAAAIDRARQREAPVIAIGTTVVRALESAADPSTLGQVTPVIGETRLLIQPGHAFRVVDQLFTNFHLPQSTLLAMVAAFAGRERVLAAYREAIAHRYRFYSYGDAMLIRTQAPS